MAQGRGPVTFLSDGEAAGCEALNARQVEHAWEFRRHEIDGGALSRDTNGGER